MALPRDRLRAHDGRATSRAEVEKSIQGEEEFLRGHVVRVPAESGIPPSRVVAVRPCLPVSAKVFEVIVLDAVRRERGRQSDLRGPRGPLGGREMTDVREERDRMFRQQREELPDRSRGMSHGPHRVPITRSPRGACGTERGLCESGRVHAKRDAWRKINPAGIVESGNALTGCRIIRFDGESGTEVRGPRAG